MDCFALVVDCMASFLRRSLTWAALASWAAPWDNTSALSRSHSDLKHYSIVNDLSVIRGFLGINPICLVTVGQISVYLNGQKTLPSKYVVARFPYGLNRESSNTRPFRGWSN